jgi:lipid-A-disaccharide synthase
MVCIALVAGEASGDLLGASLINALKEKYPHAEFIGIAGPQMIEAGCQSFYPMEALSVMGLVEVLKHLPALLKIRKQLYSRLLEKKPDVFIGIDAPDFNLALERKLKASGIKTVHYVSPTVWAWRQWRIKTISRSVDLMLTLFPFEVPIYQEHQVKAHFVGHPLADIIPLLADKGQARAELGIDTDKRIVAMLPGSRISELERLAETFIQTANACSSQALDLEFIVPFANDKTRQYFQDMIDRLQPQASIKTISGQSRLVMQASDAILLASGTATLEALLLKRPMVVAYKLSGLTFWILKTFRILKVSLYALPNLLAGRKIVEEFIQHDARPEKLAPALMKLLDDKQANRKLLQTYDDIHHSLKKNASHEAAMAIAELIGKVE